LVLKRMALRLSVFPTLLPILALVANPAVATNPGPLKGHGTVTRPMPAASRSTTKNPDIPLLPGCPNGPSPPLPPVSLETPKAKVALPSADGARIVEGRGKYKGMVLIPAGTFEMGSRDGQGRIDERPVHKVYVKDFYISKHEITARQFCRLLREKGVTGKGKLPRVNLNGPACPVIETDKGFRPKKGMADRPMTCVSWYGAQDYAKWAGGRLPTAAEWEKTALLTTPYPPGDFLTILTRKSTIPITIAVPGIRGITGMIGNVWEWCSDWYGRDYYEQSPLSNPLGRSLGEEKVIRGGSWASPETSRRIRNRHKAPPHAFLNTVGFRIVKD